jgi:hypothetical protein
MRILIEDPVSGDYFDGKGWVSQSDKAMDFESTRVAESFCLEHNLRNASIVVQFRASSAEICFPVGSRNSILGTYSRPNGSKARWE